MGEATNPGLSKDDVTTLIAANAPGASQDSLLAQYRSVTGNPTATAADMFANVMGAKVVFVSSVAMNMADLHTNFPPSAANAGLYARVNNLFNGTSLAAVGGITDNMLCRYDQTNGAYRWVPLRSEYNVTITTPGTSIPIIPLVTPPTIRIKASITASITFPTSTANGYVGEKKKIIVDGSLGALLTMTVNGLIGGNSALLGNAFKDLELAAGGWFASN